MPELSVNISKPETIEENGKKELTGYFKKPVNHSIYLGTKGVFNDTVINKLHNGGKNKACYLLTR